MNYFREFPEGKLHEGVGLGCLGWPRQGDRAGPAGPGQAEE